MTHHVTKDIVCQAETYIRGTFWKLPLDPEALPPSKRFMEQPYLLFTERFVFLPVSQSLNIDQG